jgi:hypothetical protein
MLRGRSLCVVAFSLASAVTGTSGAQVPESPVSITGTLVATSEQSVVINAKDGPATVAMTPHWTVGVARSVSAADIKPGNFIATTNTNLDATTGRSTEVRIFEPGYEPEHGTHPMPRPNTSMTHGTVASVADTAEGEQLDITYPGGSRRVLVPPEVKVTAYDIKPRSFAVPGVIVNAVTRKGPDGVARAGRLLVVTP